MPLIVKDYKWNQNDDRITIQVPLKGVPVSNVDVFTSDNYIKANYPPFLFEIFLHSTIDENKSKCTLSDDEIIFDLQKIIPQKWEALTADIDKMEMLEKRREIIAKYHQKEEELRKTKREKMATLHRFAVQQQIQRDTMNRKIIDDRRNEARSSVMNELEEWKTNEMNELLANVSTKSQSSDDEGKNIFFENDTADSIPSICYSSDGRDIVVDSAESIAESEEGQMEENILPNILKVKKSNENQKIKEKTNINNIFPIPLPRTPGTVTINFTHRDFPTPSRESQAPQEEEWLKKQIEARRATGFVAEDLRPEECNPSWLKDKGDSFYKTGNFLGAVSAYSHAIKLGSKMASLYSNRAAAHLGLGNFHKALDDCSQALDLMTPHVTANAEGRAKCHARRGAILCRLGLPEAGLADFEEALKIKPNDEKLLADMEHAKILVKNRAEEEEEKYDGIQIVPG